MTETRDERADRLAQVAVELVSRVREEPAEANWRWLLAVLPDPLDREFLAFVLAAAVPVDEPWGHLTKWATWNLDELVAERFGLSTGCPEPSPRVYLTASTDGVKVARRRKRAA